ncbi:MAG: cyclic nucleotide-binding domain-containing protein [Amphritea sp.]
MQQISVSDFKQQITPEQLRSGSLFGALSEEGIQFLLNNGKLHYASAATKVFNYGDRGDSFFIVCKGCLSFIKQHDGELYHTRDINFGEESGFVAMIALHDHAGYAVAKEDSLLLEVPSAVFSELHEKYPFDFGVITLNLARDMARTIRKLSNALVENAIKY